MAVAQLTDLPQGADALKIEETLKNLDQSAGRYAKPVAAYVPAVVAGKWV